MPYFHPFEMIFVFMFSCSESSYVKHYKILCDLCVPSASLRFNVWIGNLGGGRPLTTIATASAEPSAERSLLLPNVSQTLTTFLP